MTEQERTITLPLQTEHPLPVSFTCSREGFCLSGGPDSLSLSAGRFDGSLKFFFPDCKITIICRTKTPRFTRASDVMWNAGTEYRPRRKTVIRKSGSYVLLPPGYACENPVFGQDHRMERRWCLYEDFSKLSDFKSYAHAALQYVRPGKTAGNRVGR